LKTAIREDLSQFTERLQTAAGSNLDCLALYGSAARSEFNERYSDLNLVTVLRDTSRSALDQIAPAIFWWTHHQQHRPPLITTEQELRSSADVFAIETLDLITTHRILAGRDLISSIDVPMDLHRIQLEHELRTLLLKLRQHYVVSQHDERELQGTLAKSASTAITLFRHALIALGRPPAESKREVITAVAQLEDIDAAPLQAALDLREGRRIEAGIDTLYHRYMDAIAALVRLIDQAVPKPRAQRPDRTSSPERIG
jgi:hypothetical protein